MVWELVEVPMKFKCFPQICFLPRNTNCKFSSLLAGRFDSKFRNCIYFHASTEVSWFIIWGVKIKCIYFDCFADTESISNSLCTHSQCLSNQLFLNKRMHDHGVTVQRRSTYLYIMDMLESCFHKNSGFFDWAELIKFSFICFVMIHKPMKA